MRRRTTCPPGAAIVAVLAVLACPARSAHAQTDGYVTFGNAGYDGENDELCLESGAEISSINAGVDGSLFGIEGGYNNSDWPWPTPPGTGNNGSANSIAGLRPATALAQSQQGNFLTHGDAYHGLLKVYLLPLLDRLGVEGVLGNVDRFVRPYFGAGIHFSTDGETAPADGGRPLPTYSVEGTTSPIITYGATLLLPGRGAGFGLMIGYRGNRLFTGELDIETDTGEIQTVETDDLTWGEWSVGFRFRLGS